jgi:hypothetical protein
MIRLYLDPGKLAEEALRKAHAGNQCKLWTTEGYSVYLGYDSTGVYIKLDDPETSVPNLDVPIIKVSLREIIVLPMRDPGEYEEASAVAKVLFDPQRKIEQNEEVVSQIPEGYYVYHIRIWGDTVADVIALFDKIKEGTIRPTVSFAKPQVADDEPQ